MCTIGYHKGLNVVFKNRDKAKRLIEEMVIGRDYTAVKTPGADYFSLGVNKYGCGFVSAAINGPKWTSLVYSGEIRKANVQYRLENRGLKNPMALVSRMLPGAKNVKQIFEKLERSRSPWMGYNILLVDRAGATIVEVFRSDIHKRRVSEREVITNHFLYLAHGPKSYSEYPNSFDRFRYGDRNIKKASSMNDVFDMLKPNDRKRRKRIWREGPFKTVSSSVIDLDKRKIYYSNDLENNFLVIKKRKEQSHERAL